MLLAIAAIVGFCIAGETSSEMENPGSLYVGLGIAGMFLLIALFQIIGRKRSRAWDGVVEDRNIETRTERESYGNDDYRHVDYLAYTVMIRSAQGNQQVIRAKNDDTLYNYYRIGDRVRHHAGLKSYEKHDKSGDDFFPCNACAGLNDIHDDCCFRCKCPLLK